MAYLTLLTMLGAATEFGSYILHMWGCNSLRVVTNVAFRPQIGSRPS